MRNFLVFFCFYCYFSNVNAQVLESKIDSFEIKKKKEHQEFIESKFKKWCKKRRSLEKSQEIQTSFFWENLKTKMILDYEKHCFWYYFKVKKDTKADVDLMRKILIFFEDY